MRPELILNAGLEKKFEKNLRNRIVAYIFATEWFRN